MPNDDDKRAVSFPQHVEAGIRQHRADTLALKFWQHGKFSQPHTTNLAALACNCRWTKQYMADEVVIIDSNQRNNPGAGLTDIIKNFGAASVGKGLAINLANPGQILLVLFPTNFNHWVIG